MRSSEEIVVCNISKLLDHFQLSASALSTAIQQKDINGYSFPDPPNFRMRMNGNTNFRLCELDRISDFFNIPTYFLLFPDFDPADIPNYIHIKSINELLHGSADPNSRPAEISPGTWNKWSKEEKEIFLEKKRLKEEIDDSNTLAEMGLLDSLTAL